MSRFLLPVLLVLTLALAACGSEDDSDLSVEDVEDLEPSEDPAEEDDEEDGSETSSDGESRDGAVGEEFEAESDAADEPAPEPDPALMEQPCADHADGEGEAFIDVVSPVDGQEVADEVSLVGCSSVYEGTVRYRLVGEGGDVLLDDFTTAECGGPCVGAFEEEISLDAAEGQDTATLEVFWDSPQGEGSEEDLTEIELVLSSSS